MFGITNCHNFYKNETFYLLPKKKLNINSSIYRIITIITIITVLNLIACFYNLIGNFGRGWVIYRYYQVIKWIKKFIKHVHSTCIWHIIPTRGLANFVLSYLSSPMYTYVSDERSGGNDGSMNSSGLPRWRFISIVCFNLS